MKFLLPSHKTIVIKKDKRVNPYRFWSFFVITYIVILAGVVLGSSLFFQTTVATVDAPALPKLFTERGPIRSIQQSVEKAEKAVAQRLEKTGVSP